MESYTFKYLSVWLLTLKLVSFFSFSIVHAYNLPKSEFNYSGEQTQILKMNEENNYYAKKGDTSFIDNESNKKASVLEIKENTISYSVSVTHPEGNLPTDFYDSAFNLDTSCYAPLTVSLPTDAIITGVDISYTMVGYAGTQVSKIRVIGGNDTDFYFDVPNSHLGTKHYNHIGLDIANGITGGGNIEFRLFGMRTDPFVDRFCNNTYSYIIGNSFNITVYYDAPESVISPTNLNALAVSNSQIDLNWELNSENDDILLAFNTENTFGRPVGYYTPGANIDGGGTVLAMGELTSFEHTMLDSNTTYYYKIWSIADNEYSAGITTSATTTCVFTPPFYQGFDSVILPNCWVTQNISGLNPTTWEMSSGGGFISAPHEGAGFIGKIFNQSNAILISPPVDFTGTESQYGINTYFYRTVQAFSTDTYSVYINDEPTLDNAELIYTLNSLISISPVEVAAGWYNYMIKIPDSYLSKSEVYILILASSGIGTNTMAMGMDSFNLEELSPDPEFSINPENSHTFDTLNLGNEESKEFTLRNVQNGSLTINSVEITGANANDFRIIGFTPSNLSYGAQSKFDVIFEPLADGLREAVLNVHYDDGALKTASVNLSGQGYDPIIRAPFSESFQVMPPANWELQYGILSENTNFMGHPWALNWSSSPFLNDINDPSASIHLNVTSIFNVIHRWLISPSIDLDSFGSEKVLKFDLGVSQNVGSTHIPAQLLPETSFAVVISTDNGVSWSSNNIIFQKNGANGDLIKEGGETFYVDLTEYSGMVRLGFYASRNNGTASSPTIHLFLTNVGIHETVSQTKSLAGWNLMSLPADNIRVRELASQNLVQGVNGSTAFYNIDGVNFDSFNSNLYFYGNVPAGDGLPDEDGEPESWTIPSNFSTRIAAGQGFLWYFFDQANVGIPVASLPFVFNSVGLEPTSSVEKTLNTHSTHTLLGNPFRVPIQASNITGPVQTSFHVWDGTTFNVVTGTDIIPPFTGFFAEKNDDGNVIISDAPAPLSSGYEPSIIAFNLIGENENGITVKDNATRIMFHENANDGWDVLDLSKLYSLNYQSVSLSIIGERDGNQVYKVIDSRAIDLSEILNIPLALDVFSFSGIFTLSADLIRIAEDWDIMLTDIETGESVNLTEQSYTFEYENASTASQPDFTTTKGGTLLQSDDTDGRFVVSIQSVTTSTEPTADFPTDFALNQNYPNPFNPTTQVSYDLPEAVDVRLDVYNVMGQRVATLVNAAQSPGSYNVTFDAANLASGVYLYRLQAGNNVFTKKMTLVK